MDFTNIFEVLVLSSLIGSAIVLMILIIKGVMKDKLNCTFHYYIWLILLIKLIVPFGPDTPLDTSNTPEKFYQQSTTNKNTQIKSSHSPENIGLGASMSIGTFQVSNKSAISNAMKIQLNTAKVLSFVWMFGIVLLIGVLVVAHRRLREIIRTSIKDINSEHKEILFNCMKAMNIRAELEILYSTEISSPSLCGLIKRKILIPVNVAVNVWNEEFKYIIMHELSHLKSKDCEVSCDDKLVKEYSDTILLDIHRDVKENSKTDTKKILFALAKVNPHYESNKKFVESLVESIKNSSNVKLYISFYNTGVSCFSIKECSKDFV